MSSSVSNDTVVDVDEGWSFLLFFAELLGISAQSSSSVLLLLLLLLLVSRAARLLPTSLLSLPVVEPLSLMLLPFCCHDVYTVHKCCSV
jgi:hypothetical protein